MRRIARTDSAPLSAAAPTSTRAHPCQRRLPLLLATAAEGHPANRRHGGETARRAAAVCQGDAYRGRAHAERRMKGACPWQGRHCPESGRHGPQPHIALPLEPPQSLQLDTDEKTKKM